MGDSAAWKTEPFLGADSYLRRILDHPTAIFGAMPALLMQLGQHELARVIAEKSNFEADPMGRLHSTRSNIHARYKGTVSDAHQGAQFVNRIHRGFDPALMTWVDVTTLFCTFEAVSRYGRHLPMRIREHAWAESAQAAELIHLQDRPTTYTDATAYVLDTCANLRVSTQAVHLKDVLLSSAQGPLKHAMPVLEVTAARLVTPRLAHQYELDPDAHPLTEKLVGVASRELSVWASSGLPRRLLYQALDRAVSGKSEAATSHEPTTEPARVPAPRAAPMLPRSVPVIQTL